jgi:rhamnosyltransferase
VTLSSLSIIIPTLNGMATLPALLEAISRQRVDLPVEMIAIDSGSTDGTTELLRRHGVRLIDIPVDAFDHGLARNVGMEAARGDLAVLLVQDAVPVSDACLAALTRPFRQDAGLAGTFARQLPRPDAGPITRQYLARYLASSDAPRTVSVADAADFDALPPMARLDRCTFDNVCSCIRRSVWQRHPFRATPIGEDIEWAKTVLLAGHRLAYVPHAAVIHSHERSARYEFTRTSVLHRRLYELFGVRTIPTLPLLARAIASSLVTHLRSEQNARAVALAFAWPLGQYVGALAAVRGWNHPRSRTV